MKRIEHKESFTVETDLFEHRHLKPHFINPCCFGEDFAAWLRAKLSGVNLELSDIIQEDYGWGFWVNADKDHFWIALSYVGDGPQEPPAQWVVSVNYDPGLNLFRRLFRNPNYERLRDLRHRVKDAIASEPRIKTVPMPDYGRLPAGLS